jgi:putative flippase GtrA
MGMNRQFDTSVFTNHRIFRFLSAGVLNTVFGYTVYAILVFVNVPYLTALFIATFAGVIFNYFSFARLVFHNHGGWHVFGKFIITYVIVYLINASLLVVLTRKFFFSPYAGQVFCIPLSVLLSWLLMNKWVYKND